MKTLRHLVAFVALMAICAAVGYQLEQHPTARRNAGPAQTVRSRAWAPLTAHPLGHCEWVPATQDEYQQVCE